MRSARWLSTLIFCMSSLCAIASDDASGRLVDLPPEAQAALAAVPRRASGPMKTAQYSRASSRTQGSWPQVAKFFSGGQDVGTSVAIEGDTVVVGAPVNVFNGGQGAAFVYVKPAEGWRNKTQPAVLSASDGQYLDGMGCSVAISGDVIVVGAPGGRFNFDGNACSGSSVPGAVYVFVRPAGGWRSMTETAKLTVPSSSLSSRLGASLGGSVSIDGDVVVAGAPYAYGSGEPGAAYIFVKPPTGWASASVPTAKLISSDPMPNDLFGFAASISKSTVAVTGLGQSAVYIYVEPPGGWKNSTQTAKLLTADIEFIGDSVAIQGDIVVTGSISTNGFQGAAFVYVEPPTGWMNMTETAELTAASASYLGSGVAIDHDLIVAGASNSSQGPNGQEGAAYVFVKPTDGWKTTSNYAARVTGSDARIGSLFGSAVAASRGTIVSGAPTVVYLIPQGAAYVFEYVP